MQNALKLVFAVLFSLVLAAGCGQKGPLFLPGDPGAMQSSVPGQITSEQTDDDSGNEDDEDEADNN
jgi:predicted small lipoprotein YifL